MMYTYKHVRKNIAFRTNIFEIGMLAEMTSNWETYKGDTESLDFILSGAIENWEPYPQNLKLSGRWHKIRACIVDCEVVTVESLCALLTTLKMPWLRITLLLLLYRCKALSLDDFRRMSGLGFVGMRYVFMAAGFSPHFNALEIMQKLIILYQDHDKEESNFPRSWI